VIFWVLQILAFFCGISLKKNLEKSELNFHPNFATSAKKFKKLKRKTLL